MPFFNAKEAIPYFCILFIHQWDTGLKTENPSPERFTSNTGLSDIIGGWGGVKSISALHSKAPLIALKKWEIKLFPLHFSFHLHSFTVHQRESTQPDTQGLFPSVIRQVLRPDRKPVFHSPLPCLIAGYFWSDTALMLVMTSPLQNPPRICHPE